MTTIKLKNGSGAPTAGDLAQGEPALDLTNKRLYTEDSGGTVIEVGTNPTSVTTGDITATGTATFAGLTTTADVSFGDNDKAIFGAGSDLQIYHDGSNSYISEVGTGELVIQARDAVTIEDGTSGDNYMYMQRGNKVSLFYAGAEKLATTSTGIDVTGNIINSGHLLHNNNSGLKIIGGGDATNDGSNLTLYGSTNASAGTFRFRNGTATHLEVSGNGDISFYEDTGTTAKLFWDASAESLGIGTSSPSASYGTLTVAGTGITINEDNAAKLQIGRYNASNPHSYIKCSPNSSGFKFSNASDTADLMVIENSGNVGIVNSSPIYKLDLNGDMRFTSGSAMFWGDTNVYEGRTVNDRYWVTGGTERMRIDSSGNLLVGTTSGSGASAPDNSSTASDAGIRLSGSGYVGIGNNTNPSLYLNIIGADGDIARFNKDGTTVGSIGSYLGAYAYIGSTGGTDTHIGFVNGSVRPATATGAALDATLDLGNSSGRFKDLYLSGGVYLGGTGSANHLDDYEEGTWTPVYLPSSGSFTTLTMDVVHATYTKVGNLVTAKAFIRTDDVDVTGASGDLYLSGLPFTPTNYEAIFLDYGIGWAGQTPLSGHTQQASTYINLMYRDTADADNVTSKVTDMTDGTTANRNRLMITAVYQTAA